MPTDGCTLSFWGTGSANDKVELPCILLLVFLCFASLELEWKMRVVFSITAHQTTPIKTLIIDLSIILWVGNLDRVHRGMAHFRSTWVSWAHSCVSSRWISQVPAVPGCLTIAEGDGGAGPCVSHHPPS